MSKCIRCGDTIDGNGKTGKCLSCAMTKYEELNFCQDCNIIIMRQSVRCHNCANKHRGKNAEICPECGGKKYRGSKVCMDCYNEQKKKKFGSCEVCGKKINQKYERCRTCPQSIPHRRKISSRLTGRQFSDEHKDNISKSKLEANRKQSNEWRINRSINQGGDGDIKRLLNIHRRHCGDARYKAWRKYIFERDQYTCQLCGQIGGKLVGHHIKLWSNRISLRLNKDNGITLCDDCHREIKGSEYKWTIVFRSIVNVNSRMVV